MKNKNMLVNATMGAAAASFLISEYLFKMAFKRVDHVPETSEGKKKYAESYWKYVDWFQKCNKEHWFLKNEDETERMSAWFIPARNAASKKVAVISHGYKGNGETMANFAKMYYEMGFSVLLPDDRGHGESAGKYISFGWLDRLDYLQWLKKLSKE